LGTPPKSKIYLKSLSTALFEHGNK